VVNCGETWGIYIEVVWLSVKPGGQTKKVTAVLERYGGSEGKLEVLRFLNRHPQAKFSIEAIAGCTSICHTELVAEVKSLVFDGVVVEETGGQMTWYSLRAGKPGQFYLGDLIPAISRVSGVTGQ
jgi:hypothetical protein